MLKCLHIIENNQTISKQNTQNVKQIQLSCDTLQPDGRTVVVARVRDDVPRAWDLPVSGVAPPCLRVVGVLTPGQGRGSRRARNAAVSHSSLLLTAAETFPHALPRRIIYNKVKHRNTSSLKGNYSKFFGISFSRTQPLICGPLSYLWGLHVQWWRPNIGKLRKFRKLQTLTKMVWTFHDTLGPLYGNFLSWMCFGFACECPRKGNV